MNPFLQIDRKALRQNARAIMEYVGTPVIGVIKADGYGMSVLEAARAWQESGVNMLAVSRAGDAFTLRQDGFCGDILMLSPVVEINTLQAMADADVILPVTSQWIASFYSKASIPVRVHIAVDTGMGRFGIRWSDFPLLEHIYRTKNLIFSGIYSHFSSAFERKYRKTKLQLKRFLDVCQKLEKAGFPIGMRHIANSCGALRFPETRLDAVRIGSALTGRLCAKVPIALKPAAICMAQVAERKRLLPGDTVGYASVCRIKAETNAIVVAIGHENGIGLVEAPHHFPFKAFTGYALRLRCCEVPFVEYHSHRLPLIGRVGNQFSLFDAEDLDIQPGECVQIHPNLLHPWNRREFV